MLIVDTALRQRAESKQPIRVGLVGAGYSGKRIAYQISNFVDGMEVVAIANRTIDNAKQAYDYAGIQDTDVVSTSELLDQRIVDQRSCITDSIEVLTKAENVDVILDATGSVAFGAEIAKSAIENDKHVILMNVELDATIGAYLKKMASDRNLVYSNSDGDEPGVAMNMIRFVRSIGLKPVLAGNLKGLYDPYRNPETQQQFAAAHNQKPETMAHFADGTKLSMELTVLGNAAGFGVGKRGMHGPALDHVNDSAKYFEDKIIEGGSVDYLVGAAPSNGAFVLGHSIDPMHQEYLKYLKLGDGPYYTFYTPFHLPQLEIPLTIARAVLFGDATVAPKGPPTCDSIAIAKKDLNPGDKLDGLGGFATYALIENYAQSVKEGCLPMGVAEGCIVQSQIAKDQPIHYQDVELPNDRLIDQLRNEQNRVFDFS